MTTTMHLLTEADVEYCDNRDFNGGLQRQFNSNLGEHQMVILHDEGLYRHLRFKNPDNGFYWFDLITWPGNLTITGDIGTYTFAREQDMFTVMVGNINTSYWAEKMKHGSGRASVKNYNEERFKKWVLRDFWESSRDMDAKTTKHWWEHLKDEVLDGWADTSSSNAALNAVQNISGSNSPLRDHYTDCWESASAWERYDWHFELRLAAIVTGIRTYKAHKAIDPIAKIMSFLTENETMLMPTKAQVEVLHAKAKTLDCGLMVEQGRPGTLRVCPGAVVGQLLVIDPMATA